MDRSLLRGRRIALGVGGGIAAYKACELVRELVRAQPDLALQRLDPAWPTTAAQLYLREYLRLVHRTHALNLEVSVFCAKRRLTGALIQYATLASRCASLNGLVRRSLTGKAGSHCGVADMAMMGIWAVAGSACKRRHTSTPSLLGIRISRRITWG